MMFSMEKVEPYLHQQTSVPIDLDRLEQINMDTSNPRQRGRTTAFVVHMVGCALVARPNQQWLYIADTKKATNYARKMFLDILSYEADDPIINVTDTRVTVHTGGAPAVFDFRSLAGLDPYIRGRIIQDYFLDASDESLRHYNQQNPGILSCLQYRVEIDPC
jgi:hypothetical protein